MMTIHILHTLIFSHPVPLFQPGSIELVQHSLLSAMAGLSVAPHCEPCHMTLPHHRPLAGAFSLAVLDMYWLTIFMTCGMRKACAHTCGICCLAPSLHFDTATTHAWHWLLQNPDRAPNLGFCLTTWRGRAWGGGRGCKEELAVWGQVQGNCSMWCSEAGIACHA